MDKRNLLITFCCLLFISLKSYAIPIEYTFTTLDEEIIGGNQTLPIIGAISNDYTIINNTGLIWTDFHMRSTITGGFLVGSYTGPGTTDFGSTNIILNNEISASLDIFDLNIASGDTLIFSLSTYNASEFGSGFGTMYAAYPTVDGNGDDDDDHSVPEPGILALMSLGLVGIMVARRKA